MFTSGRKHQSGDHRPTPDQYEKIAQQCVLALKGKPEQVMLDDSICTTRLGFWTYLSDQNEVCFDEMVCQVFPRARKNKYVTWCHWRPRLSGSVSMRIQLNQILNSDTDGGIEPYTDVLTMRQKTWFYFGSVVLVLCCLKRMLQSHVSGEFMQRSSRWGYTSIW